MGKAVKVGIAQYGPIHLNLEASLERLEGIILQAAAEQIELLVLGETWLSGYPAWLDVCPNVAVWDSPAMKEVYAQFYQNSIEVPGEATQFIASLTAKHGLYLCIGANERVSHGPGNGTVYNALLIFGPQGLMNHHRKLVPTYTEKMLYGHGDGKGLQSVDTPYGRLGGAVCWEHWMPLTRQALHDHGEHIHVALWPTVHEKHQIASRHYAFEGRCFVLAAGQIMKAAEVPDVLSLPEDLAQDPNQYLLKGGSCIIGPNGDFIVPPVFEKEEIVIATITPETVYQERMTLDTSGHYQRHDVFQFEVNTKRP